MNKLNRFIVIAEFIFSISLPSDFYSQWEQLNGPAGGTVYSLCCSDSVIYAGTYHTGVFKSADHGLNWQQCSLNNQHIYSISLSSNNYVFAGTGIGIFLSTNNGINWTLTGITSRIYSMISVGNFLYASTESQLLRSTNYGTSWDLLLPYRVNGLFYENNLLLAAVNNGVYVSSNFGNSWNVLQLQGFNVLSAYSESNKVFAGTDGYGIYYTTNNGLSWIQTSLTTSDILSLKFYDQKYIAATSGGIYYSDNGYNWYQTDFTSNTVYSLLKFNSELYSGTEFKGIFKSQNGNSWLQANLLNNYVNSITSASSIIYTGSYGVQKSFDIGISWIQTALSNNKVYEITSAENFLYAATEHGLFVSSDLGNVWFQKTENIYTFNSVVCRNNISYATSFIGPVYKSKDYGNNWQTCSMSSVKKLGINNAYVFGTRFSQYDPVGIYRSALNSNSWSLVLPVSASSLFCLNNVIYAGAVNCLYYSFDNGLTWNQTNGTFGIINSITAVNSHVFIGTNSYGVLYSNNYGVNWSGFNQGLNFNEIQSLYIDGDYLYAGTMGSSVWKRNISGLTSTGIQNQTNPDKYSLSQNFPNPFNPQTKIKFGVPKNSHVKLDIFDALGKKVETLVDRNMNPGTFEVTWNASSYSSGVYFYKIQTDGFTETKRMVLTK